VGWIDLASPDCERELEACRQHAKFVGVRHVTHDEPDDDFIVREDVLRGLKTLERHRVPFDLLFFVRHLRHAATLARKFPQLPLVLDHLAKPMIKARRFDNWEANFREAASYPNVYCKLSGMVTEADWNTWGPADLKPYVEIALDAFGPMRCMFGSDWPVCELAASYGEVCSAVREILQFVSESERAQIFGQTAISFYGLDL
jgi:L-fuconolactonase